MDEEGSLDLLSSSSTHQLWVRLLSLHGAAYRSRLSRTLMHAAASFAGHALWLVPVHDDVREALAQTIEELAERTSGPRFRPHVTLLSGIPSSTPVELVRSRASAAVTTWSQAQSKSRAPLELTMEDVDTRSPRYFQFVFAHIRPTAELLSLRQACRSGFLSQDAASTPADDYMPHLSLAYGDKGADAILNDLRSAASGGGRTARTEGGRWAMDGRSFRVGAVEVWSCEGPPAEWACVESIPLSTASDGTGKHEEP